MGDRITTKDAVKQRQAGKVMYDGKAAETAGDDLFEDTGEEKPAKIAIRSTTSLNPTMTGIQITGDVTEAEWEQLADNVVQSGNALNWLLGDLCLIGSHKEYGAYRRFAEKHNLEQRRLEDLIYVCRNVTYTVRTVGLSFTHHRLVVPFYDESNPLDSRETQKQLLTYAAVNNLSVARFREYLAALPTTVDESGQVAIVPSPALDTPVTLPVISFWQKPIDRFEKDILRNWKDADAEEKQAAIKRIRAFLKDLERMG